jgi:hypothetical protein
VDAPCGSQGERREEGVQARRVHGEAAPPSPSEETLGRWNHPLTDNKENCNGQTESSEDLLLEVHAQARELQAAARGPQGAPQPLDSGEGENIMAKKTRKKAKCLKRGKHNKCLKRAKRR